MSKRVWTMAVVAVLAAYAFAGSLQADHLLYAIDFSVLFATGLAFVPVAFVNGFAGLSGWKNAAYFVAFAYLGEIGIFNESIHRWGTPMSPLGIAGNALVGLVLLLPLNLLVVIVVWLAGRLIRRRMSHPRAATLGR